MALNFDLIKKEFPQPFAQYEGKKLIYLDNGATTLRPKCMTKALDKYYLEECSNVHRGVHTLSEICSAKFERTRGVIREFIHAKLEKEIIFTSGTTDSINLVAQCWGEVFLKAGDEILVSTMEHHSNIVPWQMIAKKTGAKVREIPIDEKGEINRKELSAAYNSKTKLLAITYVSNTLGTINPLDEIIKEAHQHKVLVAVDGAQAVAHLEVDVQKLDADFFAFSAHKLFGPSGLGILYGKAELLDQMNPYRGGGSMIDQVSFEGTTYNDLPFKFEAGTPHIAGVIAFKESIELVQKIGLKQIEDYEHELLEYALLKLSTIPGLHIVGNPKKRASLISFTIDGLHPFDIGTFLNKEGIAIRTGHHCNQPLMQKYNIPGTARASFSLYNTKEDIDQLTLALAKIVELFV